MSNRDIRDIKTFGTICVLTGAVQLLMSLMGIFMVLASGLSQLNLSYGQAGLIGGALVVVSCGLIGLGGEFQRAAQLTVTAKENLRLTWTAMLILLAAGFTIGLWLLPVLAGFSAVMILGLVWIRQPIIRLTRP